MDAKEILSQAFARSEFNPDLEDHEFAGERADEGDRLADVALGALRDAGYSLVRVVDGQVVDELALPVNVGLVRPNPRRGDASGAEPR